MYVIVTIAVQQKSSAEQSGEYILNQTTTNRSRASHAN